MEGKSTKEMLEIGNDYARENGLMDVGIYLEEEWRYYSERKEGKF